jgi:ammonium transporter Rh
MEHILNATLSGGVVIGAPAGLIYNPGSALIIGAFIGIISTLCFQYLTPKLEEKLGLFDTCGIHNLHGLPGLIGGILSAVVVATYKYTANWDPTAITSGNFPEISIITADPYKQGALQIAGTFVSMGLGITFGIIAGFFMKCIYSVKAKEFYQDSPYFEDVELEELPSPHHNIKHAEIVLNTTDSHL